MSRLVQTVSSAVSKILGISLFTFGLYVIKKSCAHDEEISVLPFISMAVGSFIISIHCLESLAEVLKKLNAILISCYLILITSSAAVIAASVYHREEFEKFMSNEIELLWTLRDSSNFYREIIQTLQNVLDCCQIHSLIDYEVNLPRSCCDSTDFKCLNPKIQCTHLQTTVLVTFVFAIIISWINLKTIYKRMRRKTNSKLDLSLVPLLIDEKSEHSARK